MTRDNMHGHEAPVNPRTETWLPVQAEKTVLAWQGSIERHYPQHVETWTQPARHLRALTEEWNTLRAVIDLPLDRYLVGSGLRVLDLGAGTGWLSLHLSRHERVREIYALDSSPFNLDVMLPALAELMGHGDARIRPVLGLFTPLLVEDGFFDVVVASSAVHHAENLQACLNEVHRVTRPGGVCLILNETPITSARYLWIIAKRLAGIASAVAFKRWEPVPRPVSESGVVTDPHLGDRAYCGWQWVRAIESAGFDCERVDMPYGSYRGQARGPRLAHFIARKPAGDIRPGGRG